LLSRKERVERGFLSTRLQRSAEGRPRWDGEGNLRGVGVYFRPWRADGSGKALGFCAVGGGEDVAANEEAE